MTFKDFLMNETRAGDIIVIREHGWQIGLTRIDNENFYLHSLNPVLLDLYSVVCYTYEKRDWSTREVLVVDIIMSRGADYDEER